MRADESQSKVYMNVKLKRKLSYVTIGFYNLCAGIEYAIIFPTIWSYVHERFAGNGSMLGLVISAYSISSFFANPLVGCWADKTQNTKLILLITVFAEVIGSMMYCIGIADWFLVTSRFIAGIGGGGGAAIYADITRTTSEEERTSILAVIVSFRQFGLLIGPSFNLFLAKFNFYLGPIHVNKFTSPGLFMAIVWVLVELAVFFMYSNLTALKGDENIEHLFPGYRKESLAPQDQYQNSELDASTSAENLWNSSLPDSSYNICHPTNLRTQQSTSVPNLTVEYFGDLEGNSQSRKEQTFSTINCKKVYVMSDEPVNYSRAPPSCISKGSGRSESATDTMIESAERFIQSASDSLGNHANVQVSLYNEPENLVNRNISSSSLQHRESDLYDGSLPVLSEKKRGLLDQISIDYIRDEVVVLLALAFISAFCQTVLETVVTPLAQKYYKFEEMENSLIYFAAGLEMILVFLAIRYLSKRFSDRAMLLFGFLMMLVALGMPLLFIPNSVPGQMTTLPYFILTIFIDLIGVAVLFVCSASLLSKIMRDETQALSQGLRRSMVSLGCVLGPLWGGAYLNRIHFLFAVPLGVCFLITLLFLCSFKRLA